MRMVTMTAQGDGVTEESGGPPAPAMLELIVWLAGDECHEFDDANLAGELGRRLRAAGLPLDHLGLYLPTLHPEIRSRTIAWAPDESVQIHDKLHDTELATVFLNSPIRRVLKTEKPLVVRFDQLNGAGWTHIDIFEGRHLTEFVILPPHNATPRSPRDSTSFANCSAATKSQPCRPLGSTRKRDGSA
jgi:adenylate cyclase